MMYRTIAVSASLLLATAAFTGCASDNYTKDKNTSAHAANNTRCPVCGQNADSTYTAWHNGKSINCCSQACCDKFSAASDNEKQRWAKDAYRTSSSAENWNEDGTPVEARTSAYPDRPTTTARNDGAALNRTCPITGKSASDRYTFIDADGTRIAFSSQQAADQYMSYGPEHRAEVRSSLRQ